MSLTDRHADLRAPSAPVSVFPDEAWMALLVSLSCRRSNATPHALLQGVTERRLAADAGGADPLGQELAAEARRAVATLDAPSVAAFVLLAVLGQDPDTASRTRRISRVRLDRQMRAAEAAFGDVATALGSPAACSASADEVRDHALWLLDGDAAEAVQAHVRSCGACARRVAAIRAVAAAVPHDALPWSAAGLTAGAIERRALAPRRHEVAKPLAPLVWYADLPLAPAKPEPRRRWSGRGRAGLAVAAVCIAIALAAFAVLKRSSGSDGAAQAAARGRDAAAAVVAGQRREAAARKRAAAQRAARAERLRRDAAREKAARRRAAARAAKRRRAARARARAARQAAAARRVPVVSRPRPVVTAAPQAPAPRARAPVVTAAPAPQPTAQPINKDAGTEFGG